MRQMSIQPAHRFSPTKINRNQDIYLGCDQPKPRYISWFWRSKTKIYILVGKFVFRSLGVVIMLHNSPTHYSNLVETTSGYFSMLSQNSCKVTVRSALFRYLMHNHYCSIRVSPGTRSQKQDIYLGFQGNQDIYPGRRSVPETKIYILVWESMN